MNAWHQVIRFAAVVCSATVLSGGIQEPAVRPSAMVSPDSERSGHGQARRSGDEKAPKLLTRTQINRIRYMELRAMRLGLDAKRPDAVVVKIPRETIEAFLDDMSGHPDFRGKRTRQAFMRLTPPQKLHQIAIYKGADYVDKVEILSDPDVFKTFKRKVMPVVLRSCATAGCHTATNDEAVGLRLYKDPKRAVATTYTDFITLSSFTIGDDEHQRSLIDRAFPEQSLVLTYLLPPKDVEPNLRHPGDVRYRHEFQSRGATAYKTMLAWIRSLKHPFEGYGLHTSDKGKAPDDASAGKGDAARTKKKPHEKD
ncbi:MAG: hypothetical protein ACE5F9_09230 [Phycisphaerae bacterium]